MRKTKKCLAAGIYPKKVARCILENCTELGQPVYLKLLAAPRDDYRNFSSL